jgi:hypothetical protein
MSKQVAVCAVRSQHSVGYWVQLSRAYLVMCDVSKSGHAIIPTRATSAKQSVYLEDNRRATRRFGAKCQLMDKLAKEINDCKMNFETAEKIVKFLDFSSLYMFIDENNLFKAARACLRNPDLNFTDTLRQINAKKTLTRSPKRHSNEEFDMAM